MNLWERRLHTAGSLAALVTIAVTVGIDLSTRIEKLHATHTGWAHVTAVIVTVVVAVIAALLTMLQLARCFLPRPPPVLRRRLPASMLAASLSLATLTCLGSQHFEVGKFLSYVAVGIVVAVVVYLNVRVVLLRDAPDPPQPRVIVGAVVFSLVSVITGTYAWAWVQNHQVPMTHVKKAPGSPPTTSAAEPPTPPPTSAHSVTPTATTTPPCTLFAPGGGAESPDVSKLMKIASHYGAAPGFGCLNALENFSDGSALQTFQSTSDPAFLVGSRYGAGVADGLTAAALETLSHGQLSFSALGGQLLDRFDCWSGIGDVQVLVDKNFVINIMIIRPSKFTPSGNSVPDPTPPTIVPLSIVPQYAQYFLQNEVVLAPRGPATIIGGIEQQSFYDPVHPSNAPVTLTSSSGPVDASFTPRSLFVACSGNPNVVVPRAFTNPPTVGP